VTCSGKINHVGTRIGIPFIDYFYSYTHAQDCGNTWCALLRCETAPMQSSITLIERPALSCSMIWRPLTALSAQHWTHCVWRVTWAHHPPPLPHPYSHPPTTLYAALLIFCAMSGTGKLCGIEYFKLVILKYFNVPTWSIFTGLVTIDIVLVTYVL